MRYKRSFNLKKRKEIKKEKRKKADFINVVIKLKLEISSRKYKSLCNFLTLLVISMLIKYLHKILFHINDLFLYKSFFIRFDYLNSFVEENYFLLRAHIIQNYLINARNGEVTYVLVLYI